MAGRCSHGRSVDHLEALGRRGPMNTNTLPALIDPEDPMLRLAVAAHLARYQGQSRAHSV